MTAKTLVLVLAACLCAACASTPTERASSRSDTISPSPQKVGVTQYLAFLDTLAVSIENEEPRALNAQEMTSYQRLDGALRNQLEGIEDITALSSEQQVRLFNLHQELEGVIVGAPENRIICRREHTVGTNFRRTTCMTVAEFREMQHDSQDWIRQNFQPGLMLDNN